MKRLTHVGRLALEATTQLAKGREVAVHWLTLHHGFSKSWENALNCDRAERGNEVKEGVDAKEELWF
jgi:hypothetical protein